jgi:outer membrane protein insertion porin family
MRIMAAHIAVVLVLLAVGLPAAVAQEAPLITDIVAEGNQRISKDTILGVVGSKVGQPYSPEQVEKDRQAIDDLGWFFSVQALAEPEAGGTKITFLVRENEVIDDVCFKGRTLRNGKPIFSDEQLKEAMGFQPGQVRNNNEVDKQVTAIQELYRAKGYIYATIPDIATEERQVDNETHYVLCFTILEGVVEDIEIKGNRKTRTHVITRELDTKPGQVYNASRVQRDVQRLFNLDLFEDVRAKATSGSKPGYLVLEITVSERRTGVASIGLGWSSVQNLVGFADVADANFRGTGRRISLRLQFGGREGGEIGYFDPWFRPHRTGLNLGVYNKRIVRQAFTSSGNSFLYDEKRSGGAITLSRPLSSATTGLLTLRADTVQPTDIQDKDLPPEELALLGQSASVRSVGFALVNDTRDFIRAPTRGGYNSVSAEVAGLLGGQDFKKIGGDVRRYFKVGGHNVVAVRVLGGWITGDAPFLEQFLLGGANNLRGYEEDQFPGNKMLLLNTEFRFPLGNKITGVTFVDAGDAWGGLYAEGNPAAGIPGLGDSGFSVHVGYGVGVRVDTPIGPIRLDLGFGAGRAQTHFSIGQMF